MISFNIDLISFLIETRSIDGTWQAPTDEELKYLSDFLSKKSITVKDIKYIAKVFYPRAEIASNKIGILKNGLEWMLKDDPVNFHIWFAATEVFGNYSAAVGRILWLWMMQRMNRKIHLPFLQHFYFDSLRIRTSDAIYTENPLVAED